MAKKILKVYFITKKRLSDSDKQELTDGIIIKYVKKGGMEWDGFSMTAYSPGARLHGKEAEKELYSTIKQIGDTDYLTEENTMVSWIDDTLPDNEVFCGLIVEGSYKNYPDCRSWCRKYYYEDFIKERMVHEWTADFSMDKYLTTKEILILEALFKDLPPLNVHIKKRNLSTDDVALICKYLNAGIETAKAQREKDVAKLLKPIKKKMEKFMKEKAKKKR